MRLFFSYTSILADAVSLKTLMNHSNIQQTSEYVATNEEMLKKAVCLASPPHVA
jgi:hypothetical protein